MHSASKNTYRYFCRPVTIFVIYILLLARIEPLYHRAGPRVTNGRGGTVCGAAIEITAAMARSVVCMMVIYDV